MLCLGNVNACHWGLRINDFLKRFFSFFRLFWELKCLFCENVYYISLQKKLFLQLCFYGFRSPSITSMYRVFHRFGQVKFPNGGLILGSSQFSVLSQLPPKTMLGLKEAKIDSKISNSKQSNLNLWHTLYSSSYF